jgi:predicted DNA repair protein MutK
MAGETPERPTPFVFILIILKVALVLVIWLGIFLAMFMGYFTVPLLLVGGLVLVYSLTEIGLAMAINRQKADDLRRDFLRATEKTGKLDKRP